MSKDTKNTTLADEIITIIQTEANNNPAPVKCKILKIYNDNHVDVETDLGLLNHVEVIGTNYSIGDTGIVIFVDGDLNNNLVITSSSNPNKWVKTELNDYASLYVNANLGLCKLRYSRSFGSASADTFYTWHSGLIPAKYRPSHQCHGAFNHVGSLIVNSDGDIIGKFGSAWSSERTVIGECWWWY